MAKFESNKIKKGDNVEILRGKSKGRQGKVLRVIAKKDRVFVERANMIKRHQKPTQGNAGGIVEKEAGIHISNVAVVCPKCNAGVRVGYKIHEGGSKVRVCKRCGEELDA